MMTSGCKSYRGVASDAGRIATPRPPAARSASTAGLLASKLTLGRIPAAAQAVSRWERIPVPRDRAMSAHSARAIRAISVCAANSCWWLTAAAMVSSVTTWKCRSAGSVAPSAAGVGQHRGSGLGGAHRARGAVQQRLAQLTFQAPDLRADPCYGSPGILSATRYSDVLAVM